MKNLSEILESKQFVHPEQGCDDLFIGNIANESQLSNYEWKTKRLGNQAYDIEGKPIAGLPVFVSRREVDNSLELIHNGKAIMNCFFELWMK